MSSSRCLCTGLCNINLNICKENIKYLQYSIPSLMSYSYLINLTPTLILILISRNSRFEDSLRFLDKNIQHDFSYLFPTRNFDVGQNYVVQTQCAVKIDTFRSQVSDAVDK